MRATRAALLLGAVPAAVGPMRVTIRRIGVRDLDGDNLEGGAKALRDGIAAGLGVDDKDARHGGRVEWLYEQERPAERRRGEARYGVRVTIEALTVRAAPSVGGST